MNNQNINDNNSFENNESYNSSLDNNVGKPVFHHMNIQRTSDGKLIENGVNPNNKSNIKKFIPLIVIGIIAGLIILGIIFLAF